MGLDQIQKLLRSKRNNQLTEEKAYRIGEKNAVFFFKNLVKPYRAVFFFLENFITDSILLFVIVCPSFFYFYIVQFW
jgi:hypothetical protein